MSSFIENLCFLIGAAYFIAGSYPDANSTLEDVNSDENIRRVSVSDSRRSSERLHRISKDSNNTYVPPSAKLLGKEETGISGSSSSNKSDQRNNYTSESDLEHGNDSSDEEPAADNDGYEINPMVNKSSNSQSSQEQKDVKKKTKILLPTRDRNSDSDLNVPFISNDEM